MVDATTHSVQSSIIQSFLDRKGENKLSTFHKSLATDVLWLVDSWFYSIGFYVYSYFFFFFSVPRSEIEILLLLLATTTTYFYGSGLSDDATQ